MVVKMALALVNIYVALIEEEILRLSNHKSLIWKSCIDNMFSFWGTGRKEIEDFIETANNYHRTTQFMAEVSQSDTTFLDTTVCKGKRSKKESFLDLCTHYKPTETFQYAYQNSCHPAGIKKRFVRGEALRLLRRNSSRVMFDENITEFKAVALSGEVTDQTWWTTSSQRLFCK